MALAEARGAKVILIINLSVLQEVNDSFALGACSRTVAVIFQNAGYAPFFCKSNIEMTPLCKVEVTLPRVLGSREVHRGGGGVDEQAGVQSS